MSLYVSVVVFIALTTDCDITDNQFLNKKLHEYVHVNLSAFFTDGGTNGSVA